MLKEGIHMAFLSRCGWDKHRRLIHTPDRSSTRRQKTPIVHNANWWHPLFCFKFLLVFNNFAWIGCSITKLIKLHVWRNYCHARNFLSVQFTFSNENFFQCKLEYWFAPSKSCDLSAGMIAMERIIWFLSNSHIINISDSRYPV